MPVAASRFALQPTSYDSVRGYVSAQEFTTTARVPTAFSASLGKKDGRNCAICLFVGRVR